VSYSQIFRLMPAAANSCLSGLISFAPPIKVVCSHLLFRPNPNEHRCSFIVVQFHGKSLPTAVSSTRTRAWNTARILVLGTQKAMQTNWWFNSAAHLPKLVHHNGRIMKFQANEALISSIIESKTEPEKSAVLKQCPPSKRRAVSMPRYRQVTSSIPLACVCESEFAFHCVCTVKKKGGEKAGNATPFFGSAPTQWCVPIICIAPRSSTECKCEGK